ncbi:MAG: proline--tRNA ligase [Candidatus Eremiobacterota bacterium]
MKLSQLFIRTLKEAPADANTISNKLLLRGSFIRKTAGGIYTLLPAGTLVLRKIEQIIREELQKTSIQEIILPLLNPNDLYPEISADEHAFYFKDRSGRDLSIGTCFEEIVTDIIKKEVRSYREMPLFFYHTVPSLKDDNKAKGGLLKSKEGLTNKIYSFHTSLEDLKHGYEKICTIYLNILKRCGLHVTVLSSYTEDFFESTRFLIFNALGDEILYMCSECGHISTSEKAEFFIDEIPAEQSNSPIEEVFTPDKKTIGEVTAFLGEKATAFAKTLIYKADGKPVAVLVRGDRELNPHKLKKLLHARKLEMADDKLVEKVTGAPVGFAGPVGLGNIKILADFEVKQMKSLIVGANKCNYHYRHVVSKRDFMVSEYGDLRMASAEDRCKTCKKPLEIRNAFELGRAIMAGNKYTEPIKATFFNEKSEEEQIMMGVYSLSISRTIAAIVENHHDENGIIWPYEVSPFKSVILLLDPSDEKQSAIAFNIYDSLKKEGIEVLIDDRDARAGFKFKDADLLGIPLRVTVGHKAIKENIVEIKIREINKNITCSVEDVIAEVLRILKENLTENQ